MYTSDTHTCDDLQTDNTVPRNDDDLDSPINKTELKNAIFSQNNNKSCGIDLWVKYSNTLLT